MLYLARVHRKSRYGQAELQLLIRQNAPQSWIPVRHSEAVTSAEAGAFNLGVLLMIEINEDRQVLKVEEAWPKIVELLQTFSQMVEYQPAVAEIENWRLSLTRQSQELSRREAEMEARQEQLQQWENKLNKR